MASSLVIVESPGKIRTIKKYLGDDYEVMSSVGHVRDLHKAPYFPRTANRTNLQRMGVDPEKDWKADYRIQDNKKDVVKKLRTAAKKVETIVLATDLDREGEAIAWHLREVLGGDDEKYLRVVFNEITESAVAEAFENPGRIDMNRVNAQQARRFLDRVVGFEITPLLSRKVARGLSGGRVQSVAVKLLVEREREIRAFVPEEYWQATAELQPPSEANSDLTPLVDVFNVEKYKDKEFRPTSEDEATKLLELLQQQNFKVASHESKINSVRPEAPFMTTTLQRAASTRLNFTVRRTMSAAQRLYEAGLITYMRTDSVNVSEEAMTAVRGFIGRTYQSSNSDESQPVYLPERPNTFRAGKSSQEAHEAIRPTSIEMQTAQASNLTEDAKKLYDLIWRRFVASQMTPARTKSTETRVVAGDFELRRTSSQRVFDGYQKVYPPLSRDNESSSNTYAVDQVLSCLDLHKEQRFTKPKNRYSEAQLIRELEKRGIGRPSTYATIISTIQDRGYVSLRNRRFFVERIGELVTDRLSSCFENLMDYQFTARMETDLDEIAKGQKEWKGVLNSFYGDFSNRMEHAKDPDNGMQANEPVPTDIPCPKCNRTMLLRIAKNGVFLGCPGFREKGADKCNHTMNLIADADVESVEENTDEANLAAKKLLSRRNCPICGSPTEAKLIDEKTKIHICSNFPDCPGHEVEKGHFRIKGYEGPVVNCNKCDADMHLRTGRFGKFFACTNEVCKNTRKLMRDGTVAPVLADPIQTTLEVEGEKDVYLLRDSMKGLFLSASKYPRIRKSRQVTIPELLAHANELDPKFHYFRTAPTEDSTGGTYVVRYSPKTKVQYLTGEKNGKRTGWVAHYKDGSWRQDRPK